MSGSGADEAERLVEAIVAGDRRIAARLMRDVDDGFAEARPLLARLYPHTGRAHIVGITGNPGAGKSTLVDRVITSYRASGKTVGVVAIDPSSPFSGGAILGDRIRMQSHTLDPGVFIRSVATRGHLGGLSRSTDDIVNILDAMGFDLVLVETVGVGQDEVDVVRTAHTSVVVLVPGLGDEVQALKAGILEIADLFVVNKADREGADRTSSEIEMMLSLRDPAAVARAARREASGHHGAAAAPAMAATDPPDPDWAPPILRAVSTRGEGIDVVVEQINAHRAHLEAGPGLLGQRARFRAREVFLRLARELLWRQGLARLGAPDPIEAIVDDLAARRSDPYTEAARLVARVLGREPG